MVPSGRAEDKDSRERQRELLQQHTAPSADGLTH